MQMFMVNCCCYLRLIGKGHAHYTPPVKRWHLFPLPMNSGLVCHLLWPIDLKLGNKWQKQWYIQKMNTCVWGVARWWGKPSLSACVEPNFTPCSQWQLGICTAEATGLKKERAQQKRQYIQEDRRKKDVCSCSPGISLFRERIDDLPGTKFSPFWRLASSKEEGRQRLKRGRKKELPWEAERYSQDFAVRQTRVGAASSACQSTSLASETVTANRKDWKVTGLEARRPRSQTHCPCVEAQTLSMFLILPCSSACLGDQLCEGIRGWAMWHLRASHSCFLILISFITWLKCNALASHLLAQESF